MVIRIIEIDNRIDKIASAARVISMRGDIRVTCSTVTKFTILNFVQKLNTPPLIRLRCELPERKQQLYNKVRQDKRLCELSLLFLCGDVTSRNHAYIL